MSLSFGMHTAYAMCDKIKKKLGCQICTEPQDVAALEWFNADTGKIVSDEEVIVMPYKEVMTVPAVVCLDCIQSLREIEVPEINIEGDAYDDC